MRAGSKKLLFDIARAARAIAEFNPSGSLADYSANPMRRAATERVDDEIVWRVAKEKLPRLLCQVEMLLAE